MNTSFASQDPEESGWTSYFDDFFSNQKQEHDSSYSNNKTILVPDAASFVNDDEKFYKTGQLLPSASNMPKFSKKLDVKKPSTKKELLYDDSLDDTASSPVNSIVQVITHTLPTYFPAASLIT